MSRSDLNGECVSAKNPVVIRAAAAQQQYNDAQTPDSSTTGKELPGFTMTEL